MRIGMYIGMFKWSKTLPLTACCSSSCRVLITAGTCENITGDVGEGSFLCRELPHLQPASKKLAYMW